MFLPSLRKTKLIKWFFLPSATTQELAALHPTVACRQETEDICRYQVRARGFVPGANLHAVFLAVAHRPQMALDWHSSSFINTINFQSNSLSKYFFLCFYFFFFFASFSRRWWCCCVKFTHLKCPLGPQLPIYYTIYGILMPCSSLA